MLRKFKVRFSDELRKKLGLRHTKEGRELLDPTPLEVPIPLQRAETLEQKIARMMRSAEIRAEFERKGIETFEEADDFDVGDDYDPSSPYEKDFDVAGIQSVDKGITEAPVRPPGFVDPRAKPPSQPPRSKFEEEKPVAKKSKKATEEDDSDE